MPWPLVAPAHLLPTVPRTLETSKLQYSAASTNKQTQFGTVEYARRNTYELAQGTANQQLT